MLITKQTATRLIQQGEAEAVGTTTNNLGETYCALRAQHRTDHVYGPLRPKVAT